MDLFKYEVKVDGKWIPLTDVAACGWVYEGSGYNKYSLSSQWGYFVDHVYGLWLQPVRQDTEIKVTYPIDGKKVEMQAITMYCIQLKEIHLISQHFHQICQILK